MSKTTEYYVTDRPLPFAIRETQSLLARKRPWIVVLAIGLVLGVAGPFGTEEVMRALPRLAYWLVVAAVTFYSGNFISALVSRQARLWRLPIWVALGATGLMIGLVVSLEILALNWAAFGLVPHVDGGALPLLLNAAIISIVITVALHFLFDAPRTEAQDDEASRPALLDRLPIEKRGRLIALSVSDHYVEVITAKGRELVLMRLSDAIRETQPEPGLQVHRSHWVALSAVERARRDGARAILTLSDGTEIPVSRTYLPAAKEAGLLPG